MASSAWNGQDRRKGPVPWLILASSKRSMTQTENSVMCRGWQSLGSPMYAEGDLLSWESLLDSDIETALQTEPSPGALFYAPIAHWPPLPSRSPPTAFVCGSLSPGSTWVWVPGRQRQGLMDLHVPVGCRRPGKEWVGNQYRERMRAHESEEVGGGDRDRDRDRDGEQKRGRDRKR